MLGHPDGHAFDPGAIQEVSADAIVLAPDPACPNPDGAPGEGRYRWSVADGTLTFEVVSDPCQARVDTLTRAEWSMAP